MRPTALSVLAEVVGIADAERLAAYLCHAADTPELRDGFSWLAFYRDRLLEPPHRAGRWFGVHQLILQKPFTPAAPAK